MRAGLLSTTCLTTGFLSAALCLPLAAQAQIATRTEEIVVTANKRAESLTDVPAAISVLSGTTLETRGLDSFADYIKAVPGLTAVGASAPGHGQPILRGIGTGSGQNAPTVSIYLDEIPFTASSPLAVAGGITFDPDLADIQRLEVLKGPQSTLYGASAMGGIIKIVTAKPSLVDTESRGRLDGSTLSNGDAGYGIRGSLNVPLVNDRVGMRVAGYARHTPGWVSNVYTGQSNTNDADSRGARAALRLQINDWIETNFTVMGQRTQGGNFAIEQLNSVTLQPLYGENRYSSYYNTEFLTKYTAVSNTTNVDLGFADLTNTASYARSDDTQQRDFTLQYNIFIPTAPAGSGIRYIVTSDSMRKTDELRLSSKPGERFQWLLGGFYTDEKDHYDAHITGEDPVTGAVLPGTNGNIYAFDLYAKFRETAFFGDATYKFTDQLEATVGLRYSENKQDFRAPRTGLLAATPLILGNSSDSKVTYLATASYHPERNVTLYVRAASAYRPGSTQPLNSPLAPAQYGPDSLWNYEIGLKGDWLGGKLTTELSAYHIKWKDIQLNSLVGGFTVISNAGRATSDGGELNIVYRPLPGWSVGVAAAYNDAHIDTNNPTIGAVAGDTLPFAPKLTASANTDYEFPLNNAVTARVGASLSFQGSRYTALSQDPLNTSYKLPNYTTLDLRGGFDWSNYSVALRIDNVTDEHAISSAQRLRASTTQNNPVTATVIRPLLATVSFGIRF